MKTLKQIAVILCLTVSLSAYNQTNNQTKVSLYVELSQNMTSPFIKHFLETNFTVGSKIDTKKGELSFGVKYQLYGNVNVPNKKQTFLYSPPTPPTFWFTSHLLGVVAEYQMLKEKRFNPFVRMAFSTEIATNYHYEILDEKFVPITSVLAQTIYHPGKTPTSPTYQYDGYYYVSTPFLFGLSVGFNFRIVKGFSARISVENNYRVIQRKSYSWTLSKQKNIDQTSKLNDRPIEVGLYDNVACNIGLRYDIPLRKRK
ncbi:MAG TPA: hypothetical protein PLP27_08330 [Crocinitomicaceae bacterium]|nr:hypothetical protein [Crocinitomicaceae bacterium]